MKKLLILLAWLMLLTEVVPAKAQTDSAGTSATLRTAKRTMNFFIISRRKKGRFDPATWFNTVRTGIRHLLHPNSFSAFIASNAEEMSIKVRRRLEKKNARIGTIWFDSHGMYKKGYALFFIGHDEISCHTLCDSGFQQSFAALSPYTTEETRIILGSCYAGATYNRSSIDYRDTTRMDGDTLMMTLGKLMEKGTVYASESWVMTKPGLFHRKPAVGGHPGRKLFRDICYQPAWTHVGVWNQYSIQEDTLSRVNTIALDKEGSLVVRAQPYLEEKNKEKEISRNLNKLKPGLYH